MFSANVGLGGGSFSTPAWSPLVFRKRYGILQPITVWDAMEQVETITSYLLRKLAEAGTARFEAIAAAATEHAGLPADSDDRVRVSFVRKFFYGGRENPRVGTIEPLLNYFHAVDRGEAQLPPLATEKRAA